MKIIEIKNLAKKETHLHYRNDFTGMVVYATPGNKQNQKKFEFSLERTATGALDVNVNLLESIEYPLVPAIKVLKNYIIDLDKKGKLHCI